MIKPEQIPDVVTKEAVKAYDNALGRDQEHWMRLAIAAAINAWPQSWSLEENDTASIMETAGVFLPLPQEKNDG